MAKSVKYPMKTPDKKTKKEREEGGYGMASKEGVTYPPKRTK